ncbi:hypothetical protein HERIO_873 [Hepatospora eriocheir]|uniref:Uncharacterized protein n=1 Tax=Hepatospora eriocheir TaxID=1081669 RepID=A0A1X0QBW8_9MICR|nr:hypothetical protein HERIO_873 [Hepatospora eriocheir]
MKKNTTCNNNPKLVKPFFFYFEERTVSYMMTVTQIKKVIKWINYIRLETYDYITVVENKIEPVQK